MKIRLDFVTNSSSSSFTCVALYSEELYGFLQTLIEEKKYKKQPSWGYPRPELGLNLDCAWEELLFDKRWYKVETTEEYGKSDRASIFEYISSFFEGLTADEEAALKTLIFDTYKAKKYQTKRYEDYTDGFTGYHFGRLTKIRKTDIAASVIEDRTVAATGLSEKDEKTVKKAIEANGGVYMPDFADTCDYLICYEMSEQGTPVYEKAKEQIAKGHDIRIITFGDFEDLIYSEDAGAFLAGGLVAFEVYPERELPQQYGWYTFRSDRFMDLTRQQLEDAFTGSKHFSELFTKIENLTGGSFAESGTEDFFYDELMQLDEKYCFDDYIIINIGYQSAHGTVFQEMVNDNGYEFFVFDSDEVLSYPKFKAELTSYLGKGRKPRIYIAIGDSSNMREETIADIGKNMEQLAKDLINVGVVEKGPEVIGDKVMLQIAPKEK